MGQTLISGLLLVLLYTITILYSTSLNEPYLIDLFANLFFMLSMVCLKAFQGLDELEKIENANRSFVVGHMRQGDADLPVVATHPVQFVSREDFRAHEARVCIAQGYILRNNFV